MNPITQARVIADADARQKNLARARQWRAETKPYFDTIYGAEPAPPRCPTCGARRNGVPA